MPNCRLINCVYNVSRSSSGVASHLNEPIILFALAVTVLTTVVKHRDAVVAEITYAAERN